MQNRPQHQGAWKWPHSPIELPGAIPGSDARAANDERIAAEAYRIAEERGFPLNAALDHWLEAEKRISQEENNRERN
ncbi:MAG: hypothetical protein JWN73_2657 [Betaproteobacteria bacterium]|nr:hypothetical protein [Betaproteobacteria bacterium]